MKRSKVKAGGSSSKSKSKSKSRTGANGQSGRASKAAKARSPARPKAKFTAKTQRGVKAKASSRPASKAVAALRSKTAKRKASKPKAARSRRDSTLPDSQVTPARSNDAANGNGAPKRQKPRIIDVLQRDAPISRPLTAYESEALAVLASEFPDEDPSEANAKIELRLRNKQLGDFDPERIEVLRSFKSALAEEIHLGQRSKYFTGSHGLYAAPEDFDHARLAHDFAAKYPSISHEAVAAFIPIAVYCYYLR